MKRVAISVACAVPLAYLFACYGLLQLYKNIDDALEQLCLGAGIEC